MSLEDLKEDFEWNGEVVKSEDFGKIFQGILDKAGISRKDDLTYIFVKKDNQYFIELYSANGTDSRRVYELFRNKILSNEKVFDDYCKFLSDYNLALRG